MSEFRFTDAQWSAYQAIPEQGYSHRGWLESVFNRWLAERDAAEMRRAAQSLRQAWLDWGNVNDLNEANDLEARASALSTDTEGADRG